ncbi:MAG TPA: hypothetical protein VM580_35160 [Labilithrix sp.]|nr:hypothetical protein [Labilithrix sp.]
MTKLCLALETLRRAEGRDRTAKAFLHHFFPYEPDGWSNDRLFIHIPNEVRADLLSNWGIRGKKSALRDDHEKVRSTVTDALSSGDIDAVTIQQSVTPEILIDWAPLDDWWSFWRGTTLPIGSVRTALALARDLALFDDRWLLGHLKVAGANLQGTDAICAGLTKDDAMAWISTIHASEDGSPAGLVAALGWDEVLAKTSPEALVYALDELARKVGLARPEPPPVLESGTLPTSKAEPSQPGHGAKSEADKLGGARADSPEPSLRPPVAALGSRPSGSFKAPLPLPSSVATARPAAAAPPSSSALEAAPPATSTPPASRANGGQCTTPPSSRASATGAPLSEPPVSSPPSARMLFGAPKDVEPTRPPASTLAGVGGPSTFESRRPQAASPTPNEDSAWIPPRAEPGDMGFDLVYGPTRPMLTKVQPKYNFRDDEESTSEVDVLSRTS